MSAPAASASDPLAALAAHAERLLAELAERDNDLAAALEAFHRDAGPVDADDLEAGE